MNFQKEIIYAPALYICLGCFPLQTRCWYLCFWQMFDFPWLRTSPSVNFLGALRRRHKLWRHGLHRVKWVRVHWVNCCRSGLVDGWSFRWALLTCLTGIQGREMLGIRSKMKFVNKWVHFDSEDWWFVPVTCLARACAITFITHLKL